MRKLNVLILLLSAISPSLLPAVGLRLEDRIEYRGWPAGFDPAAVREPVTCGVPLPRGWAMDPAGLALYRQGEAVPCEARAAGRWPDGSLKWVHLDFQAALPLVGSEYYDLEPGAPAAFESRLLVEEGAEAITVSTGRIRAEVRKAGFNLIDRLWLASAPGAQEYSELLVDSHQRGLVMWAGGTEYSAALDQSSRVELESRGPLRVVLRAEGELRDAGGAAGFHYICRLYLYHDSPLVGVAFTFENRGHYQERAETKVALEGLAVELPLAGGHSRVFYGSPAGERVELDAPEGLCRLEAPEIQQARWVAGSAVTALGNPKLLKSDHLGWAGMTAGSGSLVAVGLRWFWQMDPSAIELDPSTGLLSAGLYPRGSGKALDIYSGVARTHYLRLAFLAPGEAPALPALMARWQKPPLALARPEYYCRESAAFGRIVERNQQLYPEEYRPAAERVESALDDGLNYQLQLVDNRTKNGVTWDSYGFLDWGDAMHYAWESGVPEARNIAWNHHYYDLPHLYCLEFVRSGDWRWLDRFLPATAHLMDVHLTHFAPGNPLNGACRYCPPTDHVRNDPDPNSSDDYRTAPVYVSPYTNHHKTQGLFERWYLTGDERALECALKGAEFANSFGAYTDYEQPRGAAFQVLTLLAAWQATGEAKYLNTARSTFEIWHSHFNSGDELFPETSANFMNGFLVEAFIDLYEVTGDQRIVDWVKQAADWSWQREPIRFSNLALGNGFLAAKLNDPAYRERALACLATWQGRWSNAFKDYALHGRNLPRALYYLSYEGTGREAPVFRLGDLNRDGVLSVGDVLALVRRGLRDRTDPEADFDSSGSFTIRDALALLLELRATATSR